MRILGIETSCDETAAAVVEDGQRLLSNVVNSQIDIHAEYGGVVPEVAARSHLEVINPVIRRALADADCTWDDIDAIAVTYAPGLIGSLLIGTLAARTLAIIHNKPLYKIHHVEAHVYANFITEQRADNLVAVLASSPTKFPEMASRPTSLEHASRSDGVADISENLLASGSTALSSPLDNLPDETIAARLAERDAFVSEGMVGEGVMGPEEDKGSLVSLPVSSSRATKSAETSAALLFDNRREAVSGDFGGEAANEVAPLQLYSGELFLDKHARIGIYEQEIDEKYLDDTLEIAIEKLYLSRNLPISDTKIRQLLADYLFTEADRATPLSRLSGGQKSRFQLIAMLANDPDLLILDEPTNHLDLPSIEELETALQKYTGAILYVSHDNYFRDKIGGDIVGVHSLSGMV